MVKKISSFNPQVHLSDYQHLKDFFNPTEELARIKKIANKNFSDRRFSSLPPLLSEEELSWIRLKAPLGACLNVFLKALSELFRFVGAKSLGTRYSILSEHQLYDSDKLASFEMFKEKVLSFAINEHATSASDVSLQPDIPLEAIRDRRIRRMTHTPGDPASKIVFHDERGVCRGMTDWFLFLYFSSLKFFKPNNVISHVQAVAEELKEGASSKAALLNCFGKPDRLLNFKKKDLFHCTYAHFKKKSRKIHRGAYQIIVFNREKMEGHQVDLIRVSRHLSILVDPNTSCLILKGKHQTRQIAQCLESYQQTPYPQNHMILKKVVYLGKN
ncbi:MAG: hypothetical protein ACM3JI_03845 [Anaerolineae bacterium]